MRSFVFLLLRKAFTACFYHAEEKRSSDGGVQSNRKHTCG